MFTMADRDERGAGLSDRMKQRFDSEPSDGSDQSDSSEASGRSEPSDRFEPVRTVRNVKEEWNGGYFYLPDDLDDRLGSEYARLVYECKREFNWEPDKNRHYYPVVVAAGLDAIEDMDAEAFRDRVTEID